VRQIDLNLLEGDPLDRSVSLASSISVPLQIQITFISYRT
jgi:hypothetical protein